MDAPRTPTRGPAASSLAGADQTSGRPPSSAAARRSSYAVAGSVVIAAALMLWRLDCPGLQYDETLFVNGLHASDRVAGRIGGWPVMTLSYLGALKTWVYEVAHALSPIPASPFTVRAPTVLLALVSLIIAARAARVLAGPAAGALTALLLATDPTFLVTQRLDWGPVAIGTFLRATSFLLLIEWRAGARPWTLVAAALCFGLGVYDKIVFAWYLFGLLLAVALTFRHWRAPRVTLATTAGAAFLVGLGPFILFNLIHPFATADRAGAISTAPLVALVRDRLILVYTTLSGRNVYEYINRTSFHDALPCPGLPIALQSLCGPYDHVASLIPVALAMVLLAGWASVALRRSVAWRLLVGIVVGTIIGMIPLAEATGPHHVATLLPFPAMLVAVSAVVLARRHRALAVPIGVAIALLVATAAATSVRTAASFAGLCGRWMWSGAIYDVAAFVRSRPDARFVIADWGFYCPLRLLVPSARLDDRSFDLNESRGADAFDGIGTEPTYVLLHEPETTVFPDASRRAVTLLAWYGLRTTEAATLRDLDGRPNALVLEVRRSDERARDAP